MLNKNKKKQPKKSQHDLFKETAKEHGCDESQEFFEKKLVRITGKKSNEDTRHRPKK